MTAELSGWRKSSYSGPQGNCVEVGFAGAAVGVRDTKDRVSGTLIVSGDQWAAFLSAIKNERHERT